jgi:hypothetical protein
LFWYAPIAFSREVDIGSRKENASKQTRQNKTVEPQALGRRGPLHH